MKIAVIFRRLGPYHYARLNALSKQCNLVAIEMSAIDYTYAWAREVGEGLFPVITLFADKDIYEHSRKQIATRLTEILDSVQPDVIFIPGWNRFVQILALSYCVSKTIPAVVMSATKEHDTARKWAKEWIKRHVIHHFKSGLVGGTPQKNYLCKLGLSEKQIFLGYNAVDNEYFARKVFEIKEEISVYQKKLALPVNYFLSCNRFVPVKNLQRLIEAYSKYKHDVGDNPWHLVIVGDGELRGCLEEKIEKLNLREHVHLPGFIQYPDLPKYYALASCYIQASENETWGLVVNEAMASGLPVLISDRCGCASDLVEEGENGFTFDPYNSHKMAELMYFMSQGKADIDSMGLASKRIISHWGTERFSEGALESATQALATYTSSVKTNLFSRLCLYVMRYLV